MKVDVKYTVIACLLVAAVVYGLMGPGSKPTPDDRPVVTFLARVAKLALWLAFVSDPPEQSYQEPIQQTVDADGYPRLSHARSL
jgi:hypothetical protein